VDLEAIQRLALAAAEERSPEAVLDKVTEGLIAQPSVALARVWSLDVGADQLRLVASRGRSLDRRARWSRLDGEFSRIPLGARKIGHIGATGESILLPDLSRQAEWIAHPDWVRKERIRSFAGHPLRFRGSVLGVLGLFSRKPITQEAFGWLRLFADHAAIAIANSRAFEEIERLRSELAAENAYLKEENDRSASGGRIVGESPAMSIVMQQLAIVAPTEVPVLITGESGTGKGLLARAVHRMSKRAARPLIKVNCASVPRELFESEFFGHVKGAFSGAIKDRVGRFQLADRGTLFLDEIGEIPLDLQAKLLRVLQDGELERVGEDETRRIDVRIIAATNRDLKSDAEAGLFRRDLYYRLSVFPLAIPSLRERPEDIPLLAEHFIAGRAKGLKLGAQDIDLLTRYEWPGNIRELEHVIERALILGGDRTIRIDLALGRSPQGGAASRAPRQKRVEIMTDAQLRGLERENVALALAQSKGRIYGQGGAAELLGLKPTTLVSRMKALGIDRRR
jgi:transcriptional regulator with GAF, ATPase, and Fis domain